MALTRKVWVIIHGASPPDGEIKNANAIAAYLRSQINIARVLPANARAIDLLARFCNFVLVGGPIANEWTFKLNEYVNPKYDIVVHRDKTPDETWADYVASGALEVRGWLWDSKFYAGASNIGCLALGQQPYIRVRPLQIVTVAGWDFEDTCTMGLAFRENAAYGMYSCTYTKVPEMDHCPEDATYTPLS